uniref:Carboxypeptidase n=1 Tax=Setaria viridis TaxID=4556 RepID=A0A4U6V9G0_SETVI|nr:hypothetical protein SEVIR_3G097900v2 [Setaria viridis]
MAASFSASSPSSARVVSPTLLLLLLASFACHCRSAPAGAQVTGLPGFGGAQLPSKHYAGYVTVDEKLGSRLFYYLVESERDPAEDPLVLWLNGGPGCSSFDGFVYEHGPFNFESGGSAGSLPKLHLNPYSWSTVSSVIYLDSPAGVGLSYAKDKSKAYTTGDLHTAHDLHTFLLKWFQLYPEFLKNPFYIAGESYAGIYIPTLSHKVVKGIHEGVKPAINFKGYMVGNGVCDTVFDGNAIETSTACQGNDWNDSSSDKCRTAVSKVDEVIAGLNIYNILEPCYHSKNIKEVAPQNSRTPQSFRDLGVTDKPLPVRTRMLGRAWPLRASVRAGRVPSWQELGASVPCMNDEVATAWLNNDSVRSAIHAEPFIIRMFEAAIIIDIFIYFICFSDDHDMCVPYTGSEAWTASLGYRVVDSWRPWFADEEVSGYTQVYENGLTFATIKGAGHTVPEYKPQEALAFYSRWLAGSKL